MIAAIAVTLASVTKVAIMMFRANLAATMISLISVELKIKSRTVRRRCEWEDCGGRSGVNVKIDWEPL